MGRVKLKLNGQVKASSILEVVISMVVILLVFSIAMMISANVMHSSLSVKKIYARAILNTALIKAEQNKDLSTQTFTIDGYNIEQKVEPDANFPNLKDIHLTAFDATGEKLTELRKVIIGKDE